MLVKATDFKVFLKRMVSENIGHFKDIIVPARAPDIQTPETYLISVKDNRDIVLEHYRSIDPVKLIYYHAREYVSNKSYQDEERIIAGIKSCDLQALNLLDTALLKSVFIDPAYKHWREHTTIISADCTDISPNCNCNLLGGKQ